MRRPFLLGHRWIRSTIKESIDNLPMGLCFAEPSGSVLLLNRRMSNLSHVITGKALQDATVFWQTVTEGAVTEGVERIRYETNPAFRLREGGVWSFSRRQLVLDNMPVMQILASDITELDDARLKLHKANIQLTSMNDRLRQYGKDVIEVTAREERLAMKVRIHDELGGTLLATRHYLEVADSDEGAEDILERWRRDVRILRGSAEAPLRTTTAFLTNAAKTLGVTLRMRGEFPSDKTMEALLIAAISEALNNAVRHAGATALTVDIVQSVRGMTAEIVNDGRLPEGEILEAGGLSELRNSLEAVGGVLEIGVSPKFKLTVTIPYPREVARH